MCVCVCMCVLTGLQIGQYDRITRWWCSSLGQGLLQYETLLFSYSFILFSSRPTCFNRVLDYRPPPPLYLTPIAHTSFTLRHRFFISLQTPPPPLYLPRRRATIHLDGFPNVIPSLSGLPQGVPSAILWLPSFVRPPVWRPWPVPKSQSAQYQSVSKLNCLLIFLLLLMIFSLHKWDCLIRF